LIKNFQAHFDFKFSTNPTTPAQIFLIAIMIAFENHSLINHTLNFIFRSRSRLRPINHKKGARKTPCSDVKPPRVVQPDPVGKSSADQPHCDFRISNDPTTPAQKISIAIMIAFENRYWINRTLIENI